MHQDEGHYAGKHPEGAELDKRAEKAVADRVKNNRISCRAAHKAAEETGLSPEIIGRTLDLLEIRINGCQLGLFGKKSDREKAGVIMPDEAGRLKEAVTEASDNKRISCLDLWKAADRAGSSRINAAAVCEEEGIKIHSCQLGAF